MFSYAVRCAQTKLGLLQKTGARHVLADSRVQFPWIVVFSLDSKAHAYRSLVPHKGRAATSPLRLDVTNMARYAVVEGVYEQRNTNIYDLCYERVSFIIRGVSL